MVAKEKKITQVDAEDASTFENRSEDNVLARDFPYPEFMDKALVTSAVLEQIKSDDDGIADRFQWIGRMLLKFATILKCLEPIVSFGVRATKEMKDLEKRINLLENGKLAFEEAKQTLTFNLDKLKEAAWLKN